MPIYIHFELRSDPDRNFSTEPDPGEKFRIHTTATMSYLIAAHKLVIYCISFRNFIANLKAKFRTLTAEYKKVIL